MFGMLEILAIQDTKHILTVASYFFAIYTTDFYVDFLFEV